MGLDIVMIGEGELKEAQQDPAFKLLIKYLIQNFPEAAKADIGKRPEILEEGHRVGSYSDIHVLRGLAIAAEARPEEVGSLTEEQLGEEAENFYKEEAPQTAFPHLVNHPDDSGYYVPVPFAAPVAFEGTVKGEEEPVFVVAGSSNGLLDELDKLNKILGIPGDAGQLDFEELEKVVTGHRWPTAAYVWAMLHLYARESAERFMFVEFC